MRKYWGGQSVIQATSMPRQHPVMLAMMTLAGMNHLHPPHATGHEPATHRRSLSPLQGTGSVLLLRHRAQLRTGSGWGRH